MKFYTGLVGLCAVVATSSLMSMQQEGRLNFIVDNNKCITGYSKQNMKFYKKSSEFLGKNILDVIPLDTKNRNALAFGFLHATEEEATVKVPYILEEMNFVATITALKTEDRLFNYFVKVQEAKK